MPARGARSLSSLAGVAGVPPHDEARAYSWERRLHHVMIAVALAALPAVLIDEFAVDPVLRWIGRALDLSILFAFVTGATVGYGDLVPTTSGARLWAVVMVLLGFALLSLLTATLVTVFVGEDEARLRREMHHDIRMLRDEVRALREQLQSPAGVQGEAAGAGTPPAPVAQPQPGAPSGGGS